MTITDQLRKAIAETGQTHYRIGKEANIAPHMLDRFISGERPHLRTDTVNRLCEHLGLELRPIKRPSTTKKPAKEKATTSKRSNKKTKAAANRRPSSN